MIKILDSFVADKIAAGEVIEKPLSIVKELVENSIDAGASSIIVEIRNGGKSYIRVTDDGCGIPSDEVDVAFERHATSKLSKLDDLNHITSLGFRGEALASIAAISRLTVYTRTASSNSGIKLSINGGQIISKEVVGTNAGTTMVIEDVFYNVPARRKFMGSDAREASAIIELVQNFAIYYSDTRFMLINNGATILTTSGNGDTLGVIKSIYSSHEYDKLIELNSDAVKGFISNPSITKNTRKGQLFFVNGRPVKSNTIEKGIEKGYGNRIFSGYPIAILFIDADPMSIDVNIHPGKREIKFLNAEVIIAQISEAINKVLTTTAPIPQAKPVTYTEYTKYSHSDENKVEFVDRQLSDNTSIENNEDVNPNVNDTMSDIREFLSSQIQSDLSFNCNNSIDDVNYSNNNYDYSYTADNKTNNSVKIDANNVIIANNENNETNENNSLIFNDLEYMGYLFSTYILMGKQNEVYIFDQHAAHERIFYERLVGNYKNVKQVPQPILTAFYINVTPDIYAGDRSWMQVLEEIGFDISDFGSNTFIVRGIPSYMELSEADSFVKAFLESADEYSENNTVIDKLITKSCKSAVKANEKLSILEINELIKMLAECKNPYSCPHGRPTFIKINKYEIEKLFRRK